MVGLIKPGQIYRHRKSNSEDYREFVLRVVKYTKPDLWECECIVSPIDDPDSNVLRYSTRELNMWFKLDLKETFKQKIEQNKEEL